MLAFRLDYERARWLEPAVGCLRSEGELLGVPFSDLLILVRASREAGMELYAEQDGEEFTVRRL